MYPEFVRELALDSGMRVDLRDQGTIVFPPDEHLHEWQQAWRASVALPARARELDPKLASTSRAAFLVHERSIDPRALTAAAWKTAKNLGVDFSSGDTVTAVNLSDGQVMGVTTTKTSFLSDKVVNCAGAWSGQIPPHNFPTRPVKGQMLCLIMPLRTLLKHVIRSPQAYLIPRSDGRLLVGATVEEAGFDKRTDLATIQRLHKAAVELVPKLADAKILESWAGLRPGTPDALPILGETRTRGYFVATGHFRDGILLAPITAEVMTAVIEGTHPGQDLTPFAPARFE
jgi:glycine oxidase